MSQSDDDDDGSFSDFEGEEELLSFVPFCSQDTASPQNAFPSLAEALQYDLIQNNFDFLAFCPNASSEEFFEEAIVRVNQCRQFVKSHQKENNVGEILAEYLSGQPVSIDDESLFRPVLQDDAILMSLDDLQALKLEKDADTSTNNGQVSESPSSATGELKMRIEAMEEQLARAKACIANLTKEDGKSDDNGEKQDNDTYYFSSYSHHSIHQTMLQDKVRTEAYQNAIMANSKSLFEGKTVLDIGSGTCVLSIFAAKAGARKVIAVDNSDIVHEAREIVNANGFGDIITCVAGKMETLLETNGLPLEPGETVDVIVSEWMGYALLFETMLPSVMVARDSIITPSSGTMFPNRSTIYLEGATDNDHLNYWEDVYQIDMSVMKQRVGNELCKGASVEVVPVKAITTDRFELLTLDLNTCTDSQLDFEVPFQLNPVFTSEDTTACCQIDKLVVSFDIDFDVPNADKAVSFSTGCQSQPTHWKQTTLWFNSNKGVPTLKRGQVLRGHFNMERNKVNPRDMDFCVRWQVGTENKEDSQFTCETEGILLTTLGA